MGFGLMDVFVKIGADTSELESGIDKTKGLVSNMGGAIGSGISKGVHLVGTAITAATTAVGAFAASSVKVGSTFDSSMAQVAATMGVTVDEIGELRQFALDMGATTAFSATQAADALNYMALAGYDADTSMQMLPNVLNLAAAGNMDLARASDMVTDAQSALGLSLDETTNMVDMMAKTSSKSNTSVEQLGDAILTIGGTAQIMAGGTNELSTSLGILADNGIKGSEGGTKLRNVLLSLSAPTDKAGQMLKQLGVDTVDAEGNLRPLNEIMGDLGGSLDGLGTAERADVINTIFNKQDIAAVNALLGTSQERWDELSTAIEDSAGAADAMAKTQLDNLAGDVTLFKSALEGAQILVSDALTPSLRQFVQFGTEGLTKVSEGFKEGGLSGAMNAFSEVLSQGLQMVTESIPQWVDAGIQLIGAVGQAVIDNAGVIWDALMEVGGQLAEVALELANKAADGLAEFDWAGTAESIVNWLTEALTSDTATGLLEAGASIVTGIVSGLAEAAPAFLDGATTLMNSLTDGIQNTDWSAAAKGVVDGIVGYLTSESMTGFLQAGIDMALAIVQAIVQAAPTLIDGAIEIINALSEGLGENTTNLLDTAIQMITDFSGYLAQNTGKIIEAAVNIVAALASGILNAVPTLIQNIPTIIDNICTSFDGGVQKLAESGVKLIGELIVGILQAVPDLIANFPEIIASIVEVFTTFNWLNIGLDIIKGIASGVSDLASELPDKLKEIADNGIEKIKNAEWVQAGLKVINDIVDGLNQIKDDIANKIQELADKAIELWNNISWLDLGMNLVNGIISGIGSAAESLYNSVRNLISNALSSGQSEADSHSPSRKFRDKLGKTIPQGVAVGIEEGIGDVESAMQDLVNVAADYTMPTISGTVGDSSVFSSNRINSEDFTYDGLTDAFVRALDKYGLAVEVDQREFGRIVRKEVLA